MKSPGIFFFIAVTLNNISIARVVEKKRDQMYTEKVKILGNSMKEDPLILLTDNIEKEMNYNQEELMCYF